MEMIERIWLVAIGVVFAGVGCGNAVEPPADAEMRLSWQIGPQGCGGTGVETVVARLEFDAGTRTAEFDCDAGRGTVAELRPANYELQLRGIDSEGDATYAAEPRTLTLRGGDVTELPKLRLTALPGSVELTWKFRDGRVCGANGVDEVRAALFDPDNFLVAERTSACPLGRLRIEDVPPGDYLAEIRAEGDAALFGGVDPVRLDPGKSAAGQIVLEVLRASDSDGGE